jgi:hypothetical protein
MAFDKDLRSLMQSLKKESRSLAARLLDDEQKRSKGDLGNNSAEAPIANYNPDDTLVSSQTAKGGLSGSTAGC